MTRFLNGAITLVIFFRGTSELCLGSNMYHHSNTDKTALELEYAFSKPCFHFTQKRLKILFNSLGGQKGNLKLFHFN